MLNIVISKENEVINTIKMNGHTEYDEYGKDIVCASASSMLITSVNAILEFDKHAIEFNEKNNFLLENIKKDDITNKLLNNLIKELKELQTQYPKNIKIVEE